MVKHVPIYSVPSTSKQAEAVCAANVSKKQAEAVCAANVSKKVS